MAKQNNGNTGDKGRDGSRTSQQSGRGNTGTKGRETPTPKPPQTKRK